jgi:hypothetical protein
VQSVVYEEFRRNVGHSVRDVVVLVPHTAATGNHQTVVIAAEPACNLELLGGAASFNK